MFAVRWGQVSAAQQLGALLGRLLRGYGGGGGRGGGGDSGRSDDGDGKFSGSGSSDGDGSSSGGGSGTVAASSMSASQVMSAPSGPMPNITDADGATVNGSDDVLLEALVVERNSFAPTGRRGRFAPNDGQ